MTRLTKDRRAAALLSAAMLLLGTGWASAQSPAVVQVQDASLSSTASPSASSVVAVGLSTEEAARLPEAEVLARLAASHPAALYTYAARLFRDGRRDEAVKWFYAGQLRFRFHLMANPTLPRSGEPALMASLNQVVGQPINEWAGGSPKDWAASIDQALAWDAANDNGTTSRQQHEAAWQDTRKGLTDLRHSILSREGEIRAARQKRGLENR